MLLWECYCLAIPMMQNILPRRVPFHEIWRPDDHTQHLAKTTSSLYKSAIQIVRWPGAERATGVMTRFKKWSRTERQTFLSQRICLFAKNALEAACKWCRWCPKLTYHRRQLTEYTPKHRSLSGQLPPDSSKSSTSVAELRWSKPQSFQHENCFKFGTGKQ